MARESSLVRKIMAAVKKEYPRAWVRKISDRFNRGIPDVLILFQRTRSHALISIGVLFIECKTERGRLSKVQQAEITALAGMNAIGLDVIVSRDVAKVLETLKEMGAVR